jgi:signal transduction histidine kinase
MKRDLSDDVKRVVGDLENDYEDIEFEFSTPTQALVLSTPQLPDAIKELAINAAKYGDSPVCIELENVDDSVYVSVHDNGSGIPDQDRLVLINGEQSPLRHGSGLGLLLVHWVVANLGGEIDVMCDNGTTIQIRLPKYTDEMQIHQNRLDLFNSKLDG